MNNTALLVIDVQKGLDNPALGERSNPQAEANIARLLAEWRQQNRPVIHVKHNSTNPNSKLRPELPGNAIKEEAKPLPDEPLFEKSVNSAFIGTHLEHYLREEEISDLVIVGLTAEHCVSTSVRMAANLGFDVTLVADATASHEKTGPDGTHFPADTIHTYSLATLEGEFCRVISTDELLINNY